MIKIKKLILVFIFGILILSLIAFVSAAGKEEVETECFCFDKICLISPRNNAEFLRIEPETFEFKIRHDYISRFKNFQVQISQTPDFRNKKSFDKIKALGAKNYEYEADGKDWKKLIKLAEKDTDGILYWRVVGKGKGIVEYSDSRKFSLRD